MNTPTKNRPVFERGGVVVISKGEDETVIFTKGIVHSFIFKKDQFVICGVIVAGKKSLFTQKEGWRGFNRVLFKI